MRDVRKTDVIEIVNNDGRQFGQIEGVPAALAAAKVLCKQNNEIFNVRKQDGRVDLFKVEPVVVVKTTNVREMMDGPIVKEGPRY